MCMLPVGECAFKIVEFFKAIEWIFWICIIWLVVNLAYTRYFFNGAIKWLNWLIKQQGLNGSVSGTEKGYQQFRRDLWILLVLKTLIVILIELL